MASRRSEPPRSSPAPRLSGRGPWLAVLSALGIGAMPFLVCPRLRQHQASQQASEAAGALAGCLGDGSPEALRRRAIAAAIDGDPWPARCAPRAAALEAALSALQREQSGCAGQCCPDAPRCLATAEARARLAALREALRDGTPLPGGSDDLGLAAAGLAREARAPEPRPAPVTPALPDDSSVLAEGGFDDSGLVVGTDHGWRLLLHARDKHAVLCNVAPARREARCAPLPPAIPIADSVLLVDGAPDAPPHVLAREGEIAPERWGLYHAESGELRLAVDHDPVGALLDSRGVAVVVRDGERYVLLGPGQPQLLADDDALGPPLAHGSWLATPIPGALRLRRARFDEAGAVSFEPSITLPFALPEATPRVALEACRAPSLVAIVGHPDPALEPPPVAVALLSEGRWSSHVAEVSDGRYGVACDDGGVSLTSIETVAGDDYRSSETRCTPKGCRVERRAWALDRASRSSRFLVGSLGQTPVVLWRSRLGDVRLAAATEGDPRIMLALEGDDHGGFAWERHGATLFTRGRHGLLLVASERFGSPRNHGFLLSAEGLTPLTVQR